MRVILLQDVSKVGKRGDLVEVSDGYGRNYLLPRRLAEEGTASNVKVREDTLTVKKVKEDKLAVKAKETAKVIGGKRISVKVTAGENGRMFGSVTNQQIADALRVQLGVEVDKRDVRVETVKEVGQYPFKVRLYSGVEAELSLSVEPS